MIEFSPGCSRKWKEGAGWPRPIDGPASGPPKPPPMPLSRPARRPIWLPDWENFDSARAVTCVVASRRESKPPLPGRPMSARDQPSFQQGSMRIDGSQASPVRRRRRPPRHELPPGSLRRLQRRPPAGIGSRGGLLLAASATRLGAPASGARSRPSHRWPVPPTPRSLKRTRGSPVPPRRDLISNDVAISNTQHRCTPQ